MATRPHWLLLLGSSRPIRADDLAFTLSVGTLEATADGPRTVRVRDGALTLEASIEDAPHVLEESAEIAETFAAGRPDRDRIAACARRITISWRAEDAAEITNTLGMIEPAIAAAHGPLWVFDPLAMQILAASGA